MCIFFFKQKTAYEMRISDWSSDVCSSDLASSYLVAPLVENPRVAAVTGNPRIRTRSTLIGRIQVGEFSSIIGLIKRTQRVYGQMFTVSGVCSAFRRKALEDRKSTRLNSSH